MKILLTLVFIVFVVVPLLIDISTRSKIKAAKEKQRERYTRGFSHYDQLNSLERQLFHAVHALRNNTVLWKGSTWQMILWNTVTVGDPETFREMCRQLISEGAKAPEAMCSIIGLDLHRLLRQFDQSDTVKLLHRDDCRGYPEAYESTPENYEANLGFSL